MVDAHTRDGVEVECGFNPEGDHGVGGRERRSILLEPGPRWGCRPGRLVGCGQEWWASSSRPSWTPDGHRGPVQSRTPNVRGAHRSTAHQRPQVPPLHWGYPMHTRLPPLNPLPWRAHVSFDSACTQKSRILLRLRETQVPQNEHISIER